jgi:hypothetical protein
MRIGRRGDRAGPVRSCGFAVSGRRVGPPGVLRLFATYLWNICGAAAGPLAAGVWFGGAAWPDDWIPASASGWRGACAAGGVALAWTSFGPFAGIGTAASVRRGCALGAASVAVAAGVPSPLLVGAWLVVAGWFGLDSGDGPSSCSQLMIFVPLGLLILVLGVLIAGRLWWLASRHAAEGRSLTIEAAAGCFSAVAIVGGAGGARYLVSPFAAVVLVFLAIGAARTSWKAERRALRRRGEADVRPR